METISEVDNNIGTIETMNETINETKLLTTENQLLRQAIVSLSFDSDIMFCFSCFNYGKKEEYVATTCVRCGEWTCNQCSGVHNVNHNKETEPTEFLEYCGLCYEQIKDVTNIVVCAIFDKNNEPVDWNSLKELFYTNELIDYMVDIINDYCETGEHYQYEICYLNLFVKNNQCQIGFYFNIMNDVSDDDNSDNDISDNDVSDDDNSDNSDNERTEPNNDELIDDLRSYLYDGIDGFNFESGSECLKLDVTEDIILYLEC